MAKELVIPWELKYKYAMGGWTSLMRGFLYEIREEYGAAKALKIYERLCKRDDRAKNLTNTLKDVFNIEGNDAETIGKWWEIWSEINDQEYIMLEQSKTIRRNKIIKCPWKTGLKDISDWALPFFTIVTKTINPKATVERPKAMCAGDPYCEYVYKLEE